MSMFKVQKIRSCQQCGDLLPLKCKSCTCDPKRKPRVIEFYEWPEILATGPCGCIKIRCQAEGCTRTVWRDPKHYGKGGKAISKRFFCSIPCSARSMAAARCTRQTVPCAYCSKQVVKKSYALKTWNKSFCNQTCYFLRRAKDAHAIKEAARIDKAGTDGRALLQCSGTKCRGEVTEHSSVSGNTAQCLVCATKRDLRIPIGANR